MLHSDILLPVIQGFTPRESLWTLLTLELQIRKRKIVTEELGRLIRILRAVKALSPADDELLCRAHGWLAGGVYFKRTGSAVVRRSRADGR